VRLKNAIYLKKTFFYLKVLIIINIIMNNKLIDNINIILKYANKSCSQKYNSKYNNEYYLKHINVKRCFFMTFIKVL